MKRCQWANPDNKLYVKYHDEEWGMPVHDENKLFEMLILEGLSWETILKRRETYRKAYKGFDPKIVANFYEDDKRRLLNDPGIIRNKLKVEASIINAKAFLEIQNEFGSFDNYIWGFVNHKPIKNSFKSLSDLHANTELSDKISKDLKKRGFKFVGSTIIYAFMQAIGMVNDHTIDCFKYNKV